MNSFAQRWLFLSSHKDRNTLYLSSVAIAAVISMVLIVFAIVYFSVFSVSILTSAVPPNSLLRWSESAFTVPLILNYNGTRKHGTIQKETAEVSIETEDKIYVDTSAYR